MLTMDHGRGAPAVLWRLCHSPVGQKPNGQNHGDSRIALQKPSKFISSIRNCRRNTRNLIFLGAQKYPKRTLDPAQQAANFAAHVLQQSYKCEPKLTHKQHSSNIQNQTHPYKTQKKEVHPLHPLHPLHPITFFRISNWSVATPKMPVPLFYSHTWDALINRSSKPYINKSSPYPFHYIHILSLLVFNSCLFHISCENWPHFRAFTTGLNRAGTVTGACTVTAGHGCELAPAHVVADRGMNIYLPVNFPWKFAQKYQGCDLSSDHRSEGVNQKGVFFFFFSRHWVSKILLSQRSCGTNQECGIHADAIFLFRQKVPVCFFFSVRKLRRGFRCLTRE